MCWATLLLYAGAYTTSIQAGMAFLDWPLSNSSINPDGWLTNEDMRAEHSHRLLGMKLGLLAIVLAVWTHLCEARPGVRRLGLGLLGMVIFQGFLGGMRVMFDRLNIGTESNVTAQTFAVLHAMGAELTVCLLVALAVVSSRLWIEREAGLRSNVPAGIKRWGKIAVGVLLVQILLGAIMRHAGAGLAIQTFPLTEAGGLLPRAWSFPITIHWLHRLGAVVATGALLVFVGKIFGSTCTQRLRPLGGLLVFLLAVQIALGAATIWTHKNPTMASNHMVVGAFLLASTWMLALLTHKTVTAATHKAATDSRSPTLIHRPEKPAVEPSLNS